MEAHTFLQNKPEYRFKQQELKVIYDTSDRNISPQPQRAFLSLIVFSYYISWPGSCLL